MVYRLENQVSHRPAFRLSDFGPSRPYFGRLDYVFAFGHLPALFLKSSIQNCDGSNTSAEYTATPNAAQ
jgi:hypothetical protein